MAAEHLILLSGGLDSVTMAYRLMSERRNCRAIFLDYGMRPSLQELQCAKRAAFKLSIPLEIVDAKGISLMQFGYLPFSTIIADEQDMSPGPKPSEPDVDFVTGPSGFSMPLSIACYYAQITEIANLHVGVVAEQVKNRPRLKEFFVSWVDTIALMNPDLPRLQIHTPFIDMPKADVVAAGDALQVPFEDTWSCFREESVHCGVCPSCLERKNAFARKSLGDPTRYLQ